MLSKNVRMKLQHVNTNVNGNHNIPHYLHVHRLLVQDNWHPGGTLGSYHTAAGCLAV